MRRLRPVAAAPRLRPGPRRRRADQGPGPPALSGRAGSAAGPRSGESGRSEFLAGPDRPGRAGAAGHVPARAAERGQHRRDAAGGDVALGRSAQRIPGRSRRAGTPGGPRGRAAAGAADPAGGAAARVAGAEQRPGVGLRGRVRYRPAGAGPARTLPGGGRQDRRGDQAQEPVGTDGAGPDGPGGRPGAVRHRGRRPLGRRPGEGRRAARRVGRGARRADRAKSRPPCVPGNHRSTR